MDIFEILRKALNCQYISDLKFEPNKTKAKQLLKVIPLQEYSIETLSDIAEYLYDEKPEFTDMQQAVEYFAAV